MMASRLQGKSAVVTGAGSGGIGEAVALALAAEGTKVVVNDIGRAPDSSSLADKTVEKITKAGGTAVANYDSVATMLGGENIIKTAIKNFGRIDILVNCAANFFGKRAVEMTEDEWDSIIVVHLKGHFSCAKAAALEMIRQKSGGRIINFSSRAASGGGGNLAYSTVKAGILGFTGLLAGELKEYGITVNSIVPSADTKLFPGPRPKFARENMPASLRLEPEYVAPIIIYLATDEAQKITGRIIYASGGDICFYSKPLQFPGEAPIFIRKVGMWTVDELQEIIPPMLGLG